jgi:hypothetical protein
LFAAFAAIAANDLSTTPIGQIILRIHILKIHLFQLDALISKA